jgi:hypothetical protein
LVDVAIDMMRDLTRAVAQPNADVERRRANPDGPPIGIILVSFPETNMMALARIRTNRLFKGKVLFTTEQVKTAHRSSVVRTLENRGFGDLQIAAKRQRFGFKPTRGRHSLL